MNLSVMPSSLAAGNAENFSVALQAKLECFSDFYSEGIDGTVTGESTWNSPKNGYLNESGSCANEKNSIS